MEEILGVYMCAFFATFLSFIYYIYAKYIDMIRIVLANTKGGVGKSTISRSISDFLEGDIIDMDSQKTITQSAMISGKKKPVTPSQAKGKFLVYDTAPYRSGALKEVLSIADYLLVPVKSGFGDLLATKTLIREALEAKNIIKIGIFFNDVRKPVDNLHKEIRSHFIGNYKELVLKTEISQLSAFRNVLNENLSAKAEKQIKSLLTEMKIIN